MNSTSSDSNFDLLQIVLRRKLVFLVTAVLVLVPLLILKFVVFRSYEVETTFHQNTQLEEKLHVKLLNTMKDAYSYMDVVYTTLPPEIDEYFFEDFRKAVISLTTQEAYVDLKKGAHGDSMASIRLVGGDLSGALTLRMTGKTVDDTSRLLDEYIQFTQKRVVNSFIDKVVLGSKVKYAGTLRIQLQELDDVIARLNFQLTANTAPQAGFNSAASLKKSPKQTPAGMTQFLRSNVEVRSELDSYINQKKLLTAEYNAGIEEKTTALRESITSVFKDNDYSAVSVQGPATGPTSASEKKQLVYLVLILGLSAAIGVASAFFADLMRKPTA